MKAKVITARDGRRFIQGRFHCTDCGKKIKYCLEQSLALTIITSDLVLCRECYWCDKDTPLAFDFILSELA